MDRCKKDRGTDRQKDKVIDRERERDRQTKMEM